MGDDDVLASPNGLFHCLRMLAEEASILHLDRTFAALQDALDTCNLEVLSNCTSDAAPPGIAIH